MTLTSDIVARKKSGAKRKAKGFSREELREAGVSFKMALRFGLPVDMRRRTSHVENVKLAKQRLKNLKTSKTAKKRVPEPKREDS